MSLIYLFNNIHQSVQLFIHWTHCLSVINKRSRVEQKIIQFGLVRKKVTIKDDLKSSLYVKNFHRHYTN
jgi:hypothetical protein